VKTCALDRGSSIAPIKVYRFKDQLWFKDNQVCSQVEAGVDRIFDVLDIDADDDRRARRDRYGLILARMENFLSTMPGSSKCKSRSERLRECVAVKLLIKGFDRLLLADRCNYGFKPTQPTSSYRFELESWTRRRASRR
jgi:hypothetical protein